MNWQDSIVIDVVSRVTPLAVRFKDVVTGATVADGLEVRVRPSGSLDRWSTAFATRNGAFAAQGLPGLRDQEFGAGDRAYWDDISTDQRLPFVVEVFDRLGRFLPMTLKLDLPHERFALPVCISPDEHDNAVPLYSAPSRPPVPGMATVRMELALEEPEAPASWARVEMTLGDEVVTGVADERGVVALIAPYPRIANGASGALVDASWNVQVRAFSSGDMPEKPPPDICAILLQPERSLVRDRNSEQPFVPTGPLRFGHELLLRGHSSEKVFVRLSA